MADALFEGDPVEPPAPAPDLSAQQRRTLRQSALLAAGYHPLSSVVSNPIRLHPEAAPADDRQAAGLRCGTCRYRRLVAWHNGTYPKCAFGLREDQYLDASARVSHGTATDIRRWWPACTDYQPREAS